jgi:response regulator RpfG family c-di-GMP phosphodiesterase
VTHPEPTIFIVDDEEMVTSALQGFLQLETSWEVRAFNTGAAALEGLEKEPAACVVSDFMMPGMDGITFLRRCREVKPLATRILLTGYADKENAIRAINEAGLYHYVEKPWDNEHLKLVIRNGIERSELFTELDSRISALENANRDLYDIRRRLMQAFV